MKSSEFFVVGITHVDLAWKRGRDEMSEMLEIVVIRLLDLLEKNPDFHYHIEQAAHFRELQKRRPDLIARLKPFLQSGQLEFVGGMASTLESNLPNGECFVRNLQIGLQWVEDTWEGAAPVTTGWLIDTFGIPAQVPQILQGFGITHLLANRFGGGHTRDLFRAAGLDGSEVTIAGWGSYAAHVHPENLAERFCKNWDDIDLCFTKADTLTGPGPFLVIPYTENEMLISRYPLTLTQQRNRERPAQKWHSATPGEFFAALSSESAKTGRTLPVVNGDLNPEFTGCFSLRHPIRLANRRVETRLLEAEKWAALSGIDSIETATTLEEAWWSLAFVQFHDVFTGSHPTVVYREVMRILEEIEAAADSVLAKALIRLAPKTDRTVPKENDHVSVTVFNGLPWKRTDISEILLPHGWTGISRVTGADGADRPFMVEDGLVRVPVDVPATGYTPLTLEPGAAAQTMWNPVDTALLENEWIRAEFDRVSGIGRLVWKPTDIVLMEDAGGWLAAQRDDGNFQIENPTGAEVAVSSGTLVLEEGLASSLGQSVRLSGEFPPLEWAGEGNHLRWTTEFFLPAAHPELRLSIHLDWEGESTRIRIVLPTTIDSSTGIYEVPFGVSRRKPYTPRTNARGEWPAHRFVALEDSKCGIALVNAGTGGVEVSGGTIYTTLLRSPRAQYAGMVADETSSQHGTHDYRFALVPYAGTWSASGVVKAAQEFNTPLLVRVDAGSGLSAPVSLLALEPLNVVLSAVRGAADGSGDWIVRVYETAGRTTEMTLVVPDAQSAWTCDLREVRDTQVAIASGSLTLSLKPFQIQTLRLGYAAGEERKSQA